MAHSLGQKAKLAVIWNTGFNLFRDGLQFLVMLVLVRLLDPKAYGEFGMVTSVIGFISVFAFQNYISHTIQARSESDVHYQDHFTAGAFIQLVMFLIANLVAVLLRFTATYSEIAPFVHVLSITFLLELPCELRRKMLERELDWRRLRLLHGLGLILSSLLAIAMALLGAGTYALVVPGMLVTLPFIYELFMTQKWRPTWTFDRNQFMPAFRFGIARLGSGITSQAKPLLENGFIIKILGYSSAGLLGRAIGLGVMFCQRIAMQLMYAIYPVLTKVEPGTAKFRKMSALVLRIVAWVSLPTASLFAILAKPVVYTVYGSKWLDIVPLLPWSMIVASTGALTMTTYTLLLAHNEQIKCLQSDIMLLVGSIVALLLALPHGLVWYIKSLLCLQVVILGLCFFWLWKAKGISIDALVYALAPASLGILSAASFCEIIFRAAGADINKFWVAAFYGVVFLLIYGLFLRLFFANSLRELVQHMPRNFVFMRVLLLN